MKLTTIVLSDFLSFKDEQIEFPSGLIAVMGRNTDSPGAGSNGSGKSALFDAVSWALFGKTLREIASDDVIRQTCKSCEVALGFELDGQTYFVQRQRGGKNALSFFCGTNDLTQSTMALTQAKIDQTIGMDYSIFRSVATFSGEVLRFAHATDKEQKEILEKLLGLDAYGTALTKVRAELNKLVPAIKYKEQQIEREKGLLVTRHDEIARLALERETARASSQKAKEAAGQAIGQWEVGIADNELSIQTLKTARTGYEQAMATVPAAGSKAYADLADAKANYNIWLREINLAKSAVAQGNNELETAQKRIGTPCPSCTRPLGAEHIDPMCESIAQRVLDATDKIAEADAQLRTWTDRVNAMQTEVDTLQKADRERQAQRGELLTKIQGCNTAIDQFNRTSAGLRAQIEIARRSGDQFENAIKTYDARIMDATTRLAEAEAQIRKQSDELIGEREQVAYLEFWEKGFGYSGIRSMLLDGIAQKLTDRTNHFLKVLSGGTQWVEFSTQSTTSAGELREKFIVRVFNAFGAGGYEGNSSGEKRRVDIAICLALHSIASGRAARPLGFAILDEVFENMDETGCEHLVNLLRQERETLGTIFVMSHNPALTVKFPHTMEITKKDGVSHLVRPEKAVPACETSKQPSSTTAKAKSKRPSRTPTKATPRAPSPTPAPEAKG